MANQLKINSFFKSKQPDENTITVTKSKSVEVQTDLSDLRLCDYCEKANVKKSECVKQQNTDVLPAVAQSQRACEKLPDYKDISQCNATELDDHEKLRILTGTWDFKHRYIFPSR